MARTKRVVKDIPTIWECPDDLWENVIQPVLAERDPPPRTGRPRSDERKALNGVIYQLRTGCQWNALPKRFGDDSSVHRALQRWIQTGVLPEVWAILVGQCEGLGDVDYQWQSADGFLGKAQKGATRSAPTPRIGPRTARNAACWWTARAAC